VSAPRIRAGQTGGVGCGICAGHSRLELLRPSLAYLASEPGRTAALLASGVLAVQVRFYGWPHAACVISDLWREPHREHAATSQEAPRAVLRTVQVPVRRPSAGVADCPALAGAAFQGPTFLAYLRGDGRLLGGGTRPSLVAAPAGPAVAQIGTRGGSRVSARHPVTNQVTALPGLIAARVFMTAGGIACTCAPGRPLAWRLPPVLWVRSAAMQDWACNRRYVETTSSGRTEPPARDTPSASAEKKRSWSVRLPSICWPTP
jgi:hypothetical protein